MNHVSLLRVDQLRVSFSTRAGDVEVVRGLDLKVDEGESVAIVGESGAGKSLSMLAILGLAPSAQVSGRAEWRGRDLIAMSARERRAILGAEIGVVFQDPSSSLHPLRRVGDQIADVIRAHTRTSARLAQARAVELLDLVGIPEAPVRRRDYPHQFSGGQRQRILIAMAIALEPALLIADEATTALDVTIQAQVLELLRRLQRELGLAIIVITHDLGVVAEMADRVVVLYAGKEVEQAPVRQIFYGAHHPYTLGLLESLPGVGRDRLVAIPGTPPSPGDLPSGCSFHPRCRYALERCDRDEPFLLDVAGDGSHCSACWLPVDEVGPGAHESTNRAFGAP